MKTVRNMKTEPTEALKEIKRCTWTADDFNISNGFEGHEVVDKDDAINIANIAFREGQFSPKIKRLEWVEVWEGYESAKTPLGFYVVRPSIDNKEFRMVNLRKITQTYSTLSEAKVAAQRDFEQRIKECLDLKAQQKQRLIDMMRWDEEIGLYDDNPKNHGYER
jgi:hypothetical protein